MIYIFLLLIPFISASNPANRFNQYPNLNLTSNFSNGNTIGIYKTQNRITCLGICNKKSNCMSASFSKYTESSSNCYLYSQQVNIATNTYAESSTDIYNLKAINSITSQLSSFKSLSFCVILVLKSFF